MSPTPLARYQDALQRIPPPGCGCHGSLLSVANRGIVAGIDPQQMFEDIRRAIPAGTRHVPDKEIAEAITKALADHQSGSFTPRSRPRPVAQDGKAAPAKIIAQATIITEVDLWDASPIRLLATPKGDPALLLSTLYQPTDLLWMGDQYASGILGASIRTAG